MLNKIDIRRRISRVIQVVNEPFRVFCEFQDPFFVDCPNCGGKAFRSERFSGFPFSLLPCHLPVLYRARKPIPRGWSPVFSRMLNFSPSEMNVPSPMLLSFRKGLSVFSAPKSISRTASFWFLFPSPETSDSVNSSHIRFPAGSERVRVKLL